MNHDRYGPLNQFNPNRSNLLNPGGLRSLYNADGTLRTDEDQEQVANTYDTELTNRITEAAQIQPEPLPVAMPPVAPLRRSNRGTGAPTIQLESECFNKICPITQEPITGASIKLSGTCYSAPAILKWYFTNNKKEYTPLRNAYTEEDKAKLQQLKQALNFQGGKRKHKTRRTRKHKKSHKLSRRNKHTKRHKRRH